VSPLAVVEVLDVLGDGAGGVGSSSGNLERMDSLLQRSLVDVRLAAGIEYRERVSVASLIEEAGADGSMEAATATWAWP
jgi:hypothetical protein